MEHELDNHLIEWNKITEFKGEYIRKVSSISYQNAQKQVITQVTPIDISELKSWILYSSHRPDFKDWMPYFTRWPGHEIRAYYVNVNPLSDSYHNHLVMRCIGEIVHIDEWNQDTLVESSTFEGGI